MKKNKNFVDLLNAVNEINKIFKEEDLPYEFYLKEGAFDIIVKVNDGIENHEILHFNTKKEFTPKLLIYNFKNIIKKKIEHLEHFSDLVIGCFLFSNLKKK